MTKHSAGDVKVGFCSLRAEQCACPSRYREPCDAEARRWEESAPGSSKYAQKRKSSAVYRSHEAHHVLCIASVTQTITTNVEIDAVVRAAKWCINKADNMTALPLWAHTLTWYLHLDDPDGDEPDAAVHPPPFAGRAQHDYDHNTYVAEVSEQLRHIVDKVKNRIAAHDERALSLANELDALAAQRKAALQQRDTHEAWARGENQPSGDWYEAFSMATTQITPLVFPAIDEKLAAKVRATRDAFLTISKE